MTLTQSEHTSLIWSHFGSRHLTKIQWTSIFHAFNIIKLSWNILHFFCFWFFFWKFWLSPNTTIATPSLDHHMVTRYEKKTEVKLNDDFKDFWFLSRNKINILVLIVLVEICDNFFSFYFIYKRRYQHNVHRYIRHMHQNSFT